MENPCVPITNSEAFVDSCDGIHIFLLKNEVLRLKIFPLSPRIVRSWDDNMASLKTPIKQDLSSSLSILFATLLYCLMFHDVWASGGISSSCDRAVSNWVNIILLQEFNELDLSVERVELDLVACRRDLAVTQHIPKNLNVEIRCSNAPDQSLFDTSFHLSPNLVHWKRNFLISGSSSFLSRWNGLNCDRPVNQIKVKVLDSELLKRSFASSLHIFDFIPPNF